MECLKRHSAQRLEVPDLGRANEESLQAFSLEGCQIGELCGDKIKINQRHTLKWTKVGDHLVATMQVQNAQRQSTQRRDVSHFAMTA
jgi:hypothetical protein